MSHELTIRADGKVEMAWTGETPWHNLGTEMPKGAPLEEWIKAAGMDWDAIEAPMQYQFGGQIMQVNDRRVLHRSDTGAPLGVVATGYHPVQPKEVIEFFRDLDEASGFTMETAGTLFGGRRFWAMGYIGEDAVVDNQDILRHYLLCATSLDGSMATHAKVVSTRVVCNNTIQVAMGETGKPMVKVFHSTKFDADKVKETLGMAPKTLEQFMDTIRGLAVKPVSDAMAIEMTNKLCRTEDGPVAMKIMDHFRGDNLIGGDLAGMEGTAWGWLNAATQWAEHDKRAKSDSHRINTNFFGSADKFKSKALELALAA